MPCFDDRSDTKKVAKEIEPQLESLLHEACAHLKAASILQNCSMDLQKWHEEKDMERVRLEALAKLSHKEKIALGLLAF